MDFTCFYTTNKFFDSLYPYVAKRLPVFFLKPYVLNYNVGPMHPKRPYNQLQQQNNYQFQYQQHQHQHQHYHSEGYGGKNGKEDYEGK